uniref:bifunctional diguanylate cyclase/phosphodiesterase n=1 Tax=Altericroceibacterium xinjiangense TaxID=762261 RepID=UPI000F7F8AFD
MDFEEENRRLTAELQQLRARLHLLEEAVENVRHGLCVFDAEGRIAFCNSRYPEVIGLPAERVVPGLPARELIRMAVDAGYYPPERSVEELESDFWRNLCSESELRARIYRGGRTYVIHPGWTTDGNLVATFEDITAQLAAETALRDSEARLSAMLEAIPDCVEIFNDKGALTYINPAGLSLLQASDLETLAASGHVPVPPEYMATHIDVHNRVLAGESIFWTYEIVGMGGTRRSVEAHAVPFRLPDGTSGQMSITRDITQRNAAEEALRRSEERLQLVHKATGLADFEASSEGVVFCSERFFEQVGLPVPSTKTISFEQWFNIVHPEDREWLTEETFRAAENRDDFACQFRIIRADTGETRWIAGRTIVERDQEGSFVRTIGAQLDITTIKEAESALRRSEERLRIVQEASDLAAFENDGGEVSICSDRFFEQVGLPIGDNTISIWAWLDLVHSDDREKVRAEMKQARIDADTFDLEYRIIRPDNGEVRWISCRTKLLRDKSGTVIRTLGAHRDITHRKRSELALQESEERFRLAAEAAGFGVWDFDPVTATRRWSNRLLTIFGLEEDVEPAVKVAADRVHPEDRARFLTLLEQAGADETSEKFEDSFKIIRADNRAERWVALNCWKAPRDDGQPGRIILTVRDITEERTAEEQILWNATHDALTHLANRPRFQEKLEEAIQEGKTSGQSVGLLLLDLDHFKQT